MHIARLLYLADLRYRLHAEGGRSHIVAMKGAFGAYLAVDEAPCPLAMALLSAVSRGGRPQGAAKLVEALALAVAPLEKVWAYALRRPALIYARHELTEVPTLWLLRRAGARLALEVNAVIADEREAAGAGPAWLGAWRRHVEGRAFSLADRIYVVSGYLKERLVALGVDPAKVHVTHNGIDPREYAGVPAAPPHPLTIGFVGMNHRWHRLPVVVRAFGLVHAAFPEARLWVVGPTSPETEAAIHEAGLAGAVTVTGLLPRGEALAAVAGFDVALVPTAAPHCSPLKLFEYMALGRAVIAARTPAIAEVLDDGRTGLLVAPDDVEALAEAMTRLLADASLRERLGAAAAEAVRASYTWQRNAETVLGHLAPHVLAP